MRISGLTLFNIGLAIVLLASSLWVSTTADYGMSAVSPYDPWCDINDDGKINIMDIANIARRFGALGEPFTAKAALEYTTADGLTSLTRLDNTST